MGSFARPVAAFIAAALTVPSASAQPAPGARRALADLLTTQTVAGEPLGSWLGALDVRDCMVDAPDAPQALDALRRWWIRAREQAGHARAASLLDGRAAEFSPEGQGLATAWVDARSEARERWFCEDALPIASAGLTPEAWLDAALTLLAGEAQRLLDGLEPGSHAAEEASQVLRDLSDRLRQRHRAQFSSTQDPGDALELAIRSFEDGVLERMSLGWQGGAGLYRWVPPEGADPKDVAAPPDPTAIPFLGGVIAWFTEKAAEPPDMRPPAPFAWMDYEPPDRRPRVPGDAQLRDGRVGGEPEVPGVGQGVDVIGSVGGFIPDPKDVVEVLRVAAGWDRMTRAVRQDIRAARNAVEELDAQLAARSGDLDHLARDAERARRHLNRLLQDADDLKAWIDTWSTGKPWQDDMLRSSHAPGMLARLQTGQELAASSRDDASDALTLALARGASDPRAVAFGSEGLDGALRGALGDVAVEGARAAGSRAATVAATDAPTLGSLAGRTLRFEGQLPEPDPAWSDVVVARILAAHPRLDPTDARILLSMLARAAGMGRAGTEELVGDWLDAYGSLELRGGEETLSDLDARASRPDVVFELRIRGRED